MKARLGTCAFSCVFIVASAWSMPILAEPPERLAPRPERTADERKARADELRRVYAADASTWPAPHVDPDVKWKEIGLLPEVEHPADNPHTTEKETLGKTLFFDPRLSGSGQIACASCHDPDLGWADGRTTSFGLFWDGRADSLEDQARQVLMNPDEMRSGPEHVVALLEKEPGYKELWQKAFGAEPVSIDLAAQALACFERTVVGGSSRFDSFMRGGAAALTDEALLGMDLFRREARCINCHNTEHSTAACPHFPASFTHDAALGYLPPPTTAGTSGSGKKETKRQRPSRSNKSNKPRRRGRRPPRGRAPAGSA